MTMVQLVGRNLPSGRVKYEFPREKDLPDLAGWRPQRDRLVTFVTHYSRVVTIMVLQRAQQSHTHPTTTTDLHAHALLDAMTYSCS
jgi:hypothetical protein